MKEVVALTVSSLTVGLGTFLFGRWFGSRTYRQLLAEERKGRTVAEQKLRAAWIERARADGFTMTQIGVMRTVYPDRRGTPRQGAMVPHSKGTLELAPHIAPESIRGLDEYSHMWIVYVFDRNTNVASSGQANSSSSKVQTFKALVHPPVMGGKKVGAFSTRSPHRANPLGLTLVRVDSIDHKSKALHCSGVDLVDGTHVIDIKPYVPTYDSVPEATMPRWLSKGLCHSLQVQFEEGSDDTLKCYYGESKSSGPNGMELASKARSRYAKASEAKTFITEALALDIRSVHRGRGGTGGADDSTVFEVNLDAFHVLFRVTKENVVLVQSITPRDAEK